VDDAIAATILQAVELFSPGAVSAEVDTGPAQEMRPNKGI
jgi:hypothetical protein